ncbi:MAG: serpin, partial [Clostridia bacterium]|nr:serpin [Clostridia bacterium]
GYTTVFTAMPKFETEYSVEMDEVLKGMGMTSAFSADNADFKALGTSERGNIYINRVLHRTYISVGEKGTRAGAATVVEMNDEAGIEMLEPKEIYLDRPFVYMLIDCENKIPFFIGTMTDIEK